MGVQIEPLNQELQVGLKAFADEVWTFPRDYSFLKWLFVDSPRTTVMVAHVNGRWLAAIGIFHRTYLHQGEPVQCGETYAWASLRTPESRGSGIKAMKALFELGMPLVALGGSPDTLNFMPRLGFQTIGQAPVHNLPLRGAVFKDMGGAKGRLVRRGIDIFSPILRPSLPRLGTIRSVPLTWLDDHTLNTPTLPGFQATYNQEFFRWHAAGYSEQGMFLPFRFMRDDNVVGWAFCRVAEEKRGVLVGRLLEIKFSPFVTDKERRDMLRTVCASLAGHGVAVIRALTTCPDTNAALKSLCFVARAAPNPAMVFPQRLELGKEPCRLSVLRADGGLLPLPERSELAARQGRAL